MGKDSYKNLVGQPIFKQIVDFLPRAKFDLLVHRHKSDRYYKRFRSWEQLITLLFGVFSRCDSVGEIAAAMQGLQGKLSYLGLDKSPAKSTIGDALRDRDEVLFRDYYFELLSHYSPLLSVSRIKGVDFEKFYIFDSTTIRLFSDIMKGVGRNPKGDGKKKGGLKVHMMIDAHADCAKHVNISEAKMHDKKFLSKLNLTAGSMICFDKAYNDYGQYARWTEEGVWFVGRLKRNAVYEVQEVISEKVLNDKEFGVISEEHIHLNYKDNKEHKKVCLRKVVYRGEKGRILVFITNNFQISAEDVAFIYKCRWQIELLFKKLKQNFQLHFFYSETENGIKTQIWITLIAHLLLTVLKVKTQTDKAFSTVAVLVRIHLTSYLDIFWMIQNCKRTYHKRKGANFCSSSRAPTIQMALF